MQSKNKFSVLGDVFIGETFKGYVSFKKIKVKEIPILKEKVYVYYFEKDEGEIMFKVVLMKKRNSLKGLAEGDLLEVGMEIKESYGKNKYLVDKIRVYDKSVY